jgi:peptidoglycan/xylan/chitin deacetylase (PgdA/CDA1 family)
MIKNKVVYLTIDDCPSTDFKRKVDFLSSKKIPAIFFCIGKLMEKRKKDAIYAIKKGFIIGNHSYNHIPFSELSLREAKKEIKKTDEIIDQLYKEAGVKRLIKVFRFPNLDKGDGNKNYPFVDWNNKKVMALQEYLKQLGYRQPKFTNINYEWYKKAGLNKCVDVGCTYDSYDWTVSDKSYEHGIKTLKDLLARMDENVPEGMRGLNFKGSADIIMMHDHANIKEFFVPMIEKLLKKGIKFETFKM